MQGRGRVEAGQTGQRHGRGKTEAGKGSAMQEGQRQGPGGRADRDGVGRAGLTLVRSQYYYHYFPELGQAGQAGQALRVSFCFYRDWQHFKISSPIMPHAKWS